METKTHKILMQIKKILAEYFFSRIFIVMKANFQASKVSFLQKGF